MQWSGPAPVSPQRDRYTPYITEEGVTVQTLVPPTQDAAEAVAGRLRRARAAVAARTRQMHGPLPMPPRRIPPRPHSPPSEMLSGMCCTLLPGACELAWNHARKGTCARQVAWS